MSVSFMDISSCAIRALSTYTATLWSRGSPARSPAFALEQRRRLSRLTVPLLPGPHFQPWNCSDASFPEWRAPHLLSHHISRQSDFPMPMTGFVREVRSACVDAQFSRIKRCLGDALLTRRMASQVQEGRVIVNLINQWNAFGQARCVKKRLIAPIPLAFLTSLTKPVDTYAPRSESRWVDAEYGLAITHNFWRVRSRAGYR